MTKQYDFTAHVSTIPDFWLDNLQEFISSQYANFKIDIVAPASVRVVGGPDNDLVALGIQGRWRFITSVVSAAHPGGAAGTYDVWATATDNDFTGGGDKIRYSVALGNSQGPYQVDAELWSQPISYRWANNLRPYNAMEPQRFTKYYDTMSSGSAVMLVRATATR